MDKCPSKSDFLKKSKIYKDCEIFNGVAVSNNGGFCVFACKQLHEIFGFPEKGKALL
jgi:hypothetical protein